MSWIVRKALPDWVESHIVAGDSRMHFTGLFRTRGDLVNGTEIELYKLDEGQIWITFITLELKTMLQT